MDATATAAAVITSQPPDATLAYLHERRTAAFNLAFAARAEAEHLELSAYDRQLSPEEQRLCWRAMSNHRLAVAMLADAREHLERAIRARRGE